MWGERECVLAAARPSRTFSLFIPHTTMILRKSSALCGGEEESERRADKKHFRSMFKLHFLVLN